MTNTTQTQLQQIHKIASLSNSSPFPNKTDIPFALHGLYDFLKPIANDMDYINSGKTHCFVANYKSKSVQPTDLQVLEQLSIKGFKLTRFAHSLSKQYTSLILIQR